MAIVSSSSCSVLLLSLRSADLDRYTSHGSEAFSGTWYGTLGGPVSTGLRVHDTRSLSAAYAAVESRCLGTLSPKHYKFALTENGVARIYSMTDLYSFGLTGRLQRWLVPGYESLVIELLRLKQASMYPSLKLDLNGAPLNKKLLKGLTGKVTKTAD
jgi:hypothetical protein